VFGRYAFVPSKKRPVPDEEQSVIQRPAQNGMDSMAQSYRGMLPVCIYNKNIYIGPRRFELAIT
ncbi:hypothetical protein, partial [Pseudomonas helleri]|uniref:hypothetical protein n=1 Tax=Pseudomonas helleri TaxID=1608996 RepID=UPI003FD2C3E7